MSVRFTDEARQDLRDIGQYIARDHPRRAASYVVELVEKCAALADCPERFPLVPRYEQHGVRRRVHGNHLIFYTVEAKEVVIMHILHGARDYVEILFPG
jgi:plasmid stabilization system protein ParE